jgi:hypothetical protein
VVIACVAGTFTLAAEPDAKDARAKSDFALSSRVETRVEVSVRDAVSADAHESGTQVPGARGTIVAGPVMAAGATWWQVDYDEGPDGWCSAGDLVDRTPPLPDFSLKGCFRDIHGPAAPRVTLGQGGITTLNEAAAALRPGGGVILVPPGTYRDLSLGLGRAGGMDITVRGVLGPDGARPKFVAEGGTFFSFGDRADDREGRPLPPNRNCAMLENVEVEGYGTAVFVGNCARFVMKNNYIHHAKNSMILTENLRGQQRLSIEFYGNEISHGGQGNAKHNLYLHRGLDETSWLSVKFINNYCHSSRNSSCLKSIANENLVVGNLFEATAESEPEKSKYASTMLVDIPAASHNLVAYNAFTYSGSTPSYTPVALRCRASICGCDRPPYGGKEFFSPAYWKAVGGRGTDCKMPDPRAAVNPFLIHTWIYGNTFLYTGSSPEPPAPIMNQGTAPHVAAVTFGPKLPLKLPEGWVERSRAWAANNVYCGVRERYKESNEGVWDPKLKGAFERGNEKWLSEPGTRWLRPYVQWPDRPPAAVQMIIPVGGEDGQAIDLPKWFPTIVLDDLPENIKAQWKSRPYYRRSESRAESLKQATPTRGAGEVTTGGT